MPVKEAQARIKINKLLDTAGWRFFDDAQGHTNVVVEPNVKLTQAQVDAMGNDIETSSKGFIDFLLLDEQGLPLVVLEAKAEGRCAEEDSMEDDNPEDQIRELLVHKHYFPLNDIEACHGFDIRSLATQPRFDVMQALFEEFVSFYPAETLE